MRLLEYERLHPSQVSLEFYVAQLEKKQAEVIRKYYFEEKTWSKIQKRCTYPPVRFPNAGMTALPPLPLWASTWVRFLENLLTFDR